MPIFILSCCLPAFTLQSAQKLLATSLLLNFISSTCYKFRTHNKDMYVKMS